MDNLNKFKLASSSITDRFLTGSAQFSRTVTTKMKEILQTPSPESKLVDQATLETLDEPNWSLNLRICAMINSEQINGTEIVKSIKKKLNSNKGSVCQKLGLDLLEICMANCEKVPSEVASEKVVEEMVAMVQDRRTGDRNRSKAVQLIRVWGESDELMYLPVFHQTHLSLKTNGIPVGQRGGNTSPVYQPTESTAYQQPMQPTNRYPLPDLDLMDLEDDTSAYTYGGQTVDQKKELLLVARNSLDLLSSILDSGIEPIPINDELTVSMLEKCKESLPIVQRIAETTTNNDILLFEALNLHDELEQIISKCAEIKSKTVLASSQTKETIESSQNETHLTNDVKVKEESQTSLIRKDESIDKEETV